jgi:hypothetical protein
MPKRSACVAVIAAAFVLASAFQPFDATALGFRLGPFRFHMPYYGRHARRLGRTEHVARSDLASPPETTESVSPFLLSPVLAWPSLSGAIFWPASSTARGLGYDTIFSQAFGKFPQQRGAEMCPYRMAVDQIVGRIARQTMPTEAQKPALQKLATALGQANGYLIKSCPSEIPPQPAARLALMNRQIDATIMALQIVRPALQEFVQSLDDKQRAALDGHAPSAEASASCKPGTAAFKPAAQIEQAVQPTDAQSAAMATVVDAFDRAAAALDAACARKPPATALERLDAAVARLDATWRAVQTIQVALANFQKDLSDEQNSRLNALDIVSAR